MTLELFGEESLECVGSYFVMVSPDSWDYVEVTCVDVDAEEVGRNVLMLEKVDFP